MVIYVDLDTQTIVQQPGVLGAPPTLAVPRSSSVPIWVQFCRKGLIVDPETVKVPILTSSMANPTIVTTDGDHGLTGTPTVLITDHEGIPRYITSSSVASQSSIVCTAHGLTTGDIVEIFDHRESSPALDGSYRVTVSDANTFTIPRAVTTAGYGGYMIRATSSPDINGSRVATVIAATTFSVPVNVTSAGRFGAVSKVSPITLRWIVKSEGEYDGPAVATTTDFLKTGSGNTTIYKSNCNYITNELNSLLGIDASTSGTYSVSGSTITTSAAHGLVANDAIVFAATVTMPGGLIAGQTYYILSVGGANTFTVSEKKQGSAVVTTSVGSGALTYVGYPVADDISEAKLMAEISWTGAAPGKTSPIAHSIKNDLYKGDETTPIATSGADGKTALDSGVTYKVVTFASPLSSANWHFLGAPLVTTTDATPPGITVVGLNARTSSGFTCYLSGAPNTANFKLEWSVRLD